MTFTIPSTRSSGYLIKADADWNVLVNDIIDLESRISTLEGAGGVTTPTNVPVGGIIIWSGSIASIPAGFAICDGTSSTPDLRDRFVIGAGSTYAVGDTGGATTHTHSGGSTVSNGAHDHSFSGTTGGASTSGNALTGGVSVTTSGHTHTFSGSTNSNGSHTHSVGTTGSASSLPPYYALAYIMRTS